MRKIFFQEGFTLFEVMVAMTIFSVFVTMFLVAKGYNMADSTVMKEEVKLKSLCTDKINEIIASPPEFKESLTLTSEIKTFENDKNYEAKITYKRLKIPDYNKIKGTSQEDENLQRADEKENQNAMQAQLMKKVQENLKEMIWQVEVQVKNKETKATYTLGSWLLNQEAQLKNLDTM